MTKILIENALRQVIVNKNMHEIALRDGHVHQRENKFTGPMAPLLPNCWAQVKTTYPFGRYKNIDLVSFLVPVTNGEKPKNISGSSPNIKWALEAKHYSPHQNATLQTFLNYSLYGPVSDLFKLIDCGFKKNYILQLQTEITDFTIHPYSSYITLMNTFPFFSIYLGVTEPTARANIATIVAQNRLQELEQFSRNALDQNLIYNNMSSDVRDKVADVKVTIHYLISGPFDRVSLVRRLNRQGYNPSCPYRDQAIERKQVFKAKLQIESATEM